MGRPTLYKKEYCKQLLEYFNVKPYETVVKSIPTKSGDVADILERQAVDFPSVSAFACEIGVHRATLYDWAEANPEFKEVFDLCKQYQERYISINGMHNLVPANFAIFTAKNVLGWRDKQPGEDFDSNKDLRTESELDDRIKTLLDKYSNDD